MHVPPLGIKTIRSAIALDDMSIAIISISLFMIFPHFALMF